MGQITRTQFGCTKTVTLTNSQIIAASDDSFVTLVGAIPGKIIVPVFGLLRMNWFADYGNVDALSQEWIGVSGTVSGDDWTIGFAGANAGVTFAAGQSVLSSFGPDANYFYNVPVLTVGSQPLLFSINNNGAGPFSGGDPRNELTVEAHYLVI